MTVMTVVALPIVVLPLERVPLPVGYHTQGRTHKSIRMQ
jgi:hypothetical protein